MFKMFSKRNQMEQMKDNLVYDILPQPLRVQIVHIWQKGFGKDEDWHPGPGMAYDEIHRILCGEHGELHQLPQVSRRSLHVGEIIAEYFVYLTDTSKALDVVRVVFSTMEKRLHRPIEMRGCWEDPFRLSRYNAPEIIEELNCKFKEYNIGYQYNQGRIDKIPYVEPMPLKERLVAGQPARNLRKIRDMIGSAAVTAIHDPYVSTGSLDTMLKLADIGAGFSPSLRILGTAAALAKSTERKSFLGLLKDINAERNALWEARFYSAASKPHRRFLALDDGSIVTCGMSFNHIDKDEVLDHEPSGSENANHDHQLFEEKWKSATPV